MRPGQHSTKTDLIDQGSRGVAEVYRDLADNVPNFRTYTEEPHRHETEMGFRIVEWVLHQRGLAFFELIAAYPTLRIIAVTPPDRELGDLISEKATNPKFRRGE